MKEKILIVNDDDDIREMASIILQAKGYETFEAENGCKGIEQALLKKPDLILLDIMMPVMDGFEACQKLKSLPEFKDIPILFLSSLTNPKDKIKALELGGVDFINNVVDQGELLARVQTHLHIQSLRRSLMESNEQLIKKQKSLDDDLNAAAMIQRSYLPSTNLIIPNLQIASIWLPANPLGGDIFNVIQSGNDKIIFYILDVSGHDVPSALVTVSVSQYLQKASISSLVSPKQMMLDLDREYPMERFNRYFTMFYGVLDISSGILSYSSAGHPPGIILSKNNGIKLLNCEGMIIGLNQNLPFEEDTVKLNHGDKVILYTDGVIEMKDPKGELYGSEKLYALLEKLKDESIVEIINAIQTSLMELSHGVTSQDDISIICLEFRGE